MKDFSKLGYDSGQSPLERRLFSSAGTPLKNDFNAHQPNTKRQDFLYSKTQGLKDIVRKSSSSKSTNRQDSPEDDQKGRGLFGSHTKMVPDRERPGTSGVVVIEGGKRDPDVPSTSGIIQKETNSNKKHSKTQRKQLVVNDFDDDTEESNYESSESTSDEVDKKMISKDHLREMPATEELTRSLKSPVNKSTSKYNMFQAAAGSRIGSDHKIEEISHSRSSRKGRRKSVETGVTFSRESGVTFFSGEQPHEAVEKTRGQSPKSGGSKSLFTVGGGRKGSATDVIELPTTDVTRSRNKRNDSGRPTTGTDTPAVEQRSLFGASSQGPLPLPRKQVLKPITDRRPLPEINK